MNNLLLLKLFNSVFLSKTTIKDKYDASRYYTNSEIKSANPSQQTAGFTLLEVIVIAVIIGILSAIAAPSWLAFTNRQKLNKLNDVVFSALQEALQEAKKTKRNYSVWFRKNSGSGELEYAVVRTKKPDPTNGTDIDVLETDITAWKLWKPLGREIEANSKQFLIGTNIKTTDQNTAETNLTWNFTTARKITFDHRGTLPGNQLGTAGLKVIVAIPNATSPTQPSTTKRCVIIQTLLGGMRTEEDTKCD